MWKPARGKFTGERRQGSQCLGIGRHRDGRAPFFGRRASPVKNRRDAVDSERETRECTVACWGGGRPLTLGLLDGLVHLRAGEVRQGKSHGRRRPPIPAFRPCRESVNTAAERCSEFTQFCGRTLDLDRLAADRPELARQKIAGARMPRQELH